MLNINNLKKATQEENKENSPQETVDKKNTNLIKKRYKEYIDLLEKYKLKNTFFMLFYFILGVVFTLMLVFRLNMLEPSNILNEQAEYQKESSISWYIKGLIDYEKIYKNTGKPLCITSELQKIESEKKSKELLVYDYVGIINQLNSKSNSSLEEQINAENITLLRKTVDLFSCTQ